MKYFFTIATAAVLLCAGARAATPSVETFDPTYFRSTNASGVGPSNQITLRVENLPSVTGSGVSVKAGANTTTSTNLNEVTVNADVSHTEVSNATNGLNSALTTKITNATNDLHTTVEADIVNATNGLSGVLVTRITNATNDLNTVLSASIAAKVPNSRTIGTTSPLSGGGDLSADRTLSIQNAAADGSTKGAASFTPNDFDATSGNIALDYVNGQKASGSVPGFLSVADWIAFNGKQAAGNYITALTGDVTASGPGSASATIANNAVTTAKIANNAVDGTKIALGSDAQGDVMYYNGTDWVRLAAGTSGWFLKTLGAGANPVWAAATVSGGGGPFTNLSVYQGFWDTNLDTGRYTHMTNGNVIWGVGGGTNASGNNNVSLDDTGTENLANALIFGVAGTGIGSGSDYIVNDGRARLAAGHVNLDSGGVVSMDLSGANAYINGARGVVTNLSSLVSSNATFGTNIAGPVTNTLTTYGTNGSKTFEITDAGAVNLYGSGPGALTLWDSDASQKGTITAPSDFTANRTFTLPDASGTVALTTDVSAALSDTAFASSWNGVTTIGASKNAIYDWAHTFDTDDDGKVNVLDMGAGLVKTDSGGVVSVATADTDYTTPSGTETFTGKTYDASATGNVLKFKSYLKLGQNWRKVDGTGCTLPNTNDFTGTNFMMPRFSGSTVSNNNFVRFAFRVPKNLDTSVDLVASLTVRLTAADTGAHQYHLGMVSIANSANSEGTPANFVALNINGDASGAAGDLESVENVTLTSWRSNMTAGQWCLVELRRAGDSAPDASNVASDLMELEIEIPESQ